MKQILQKSFALKAFMLIATLIMGVSGAWAETYELVKVTSVEAGGLYVFEQTYNGTGYVMNNTVSSSTLQTTTTYKTTELSGTESYVWTLETASEGYYLKNVSLTSNSYLNNASSTGVSLGSKSSKWVFNFQTDETVLIQNKSNQDRFLGFPYGGGTVTYGYKAYATSNLNTYPHAIIVYKLVATSDTRTPVTLQWSATTASATLGQTFTAPTLTVDPTAAAREVVYSSDDPDVASVNSSTGAITIEGAGTVTITAKITNSTTYLDANASYTLTVADPDVPGQTAGNPYTIAQAIAAIDAGTGVTGVYVTGIISNVESFNSNYGSITYWISDDGTTTNQFEVYGGLNLNGEPFTALTDLKVGAEVVVKGNIKKYSGIYEFDKNNVLISITFSEKEEAGLAFETTEFNINVDDDFTAPTLTNPNNLTVTYSSDNEDVAIVNSTTGSISIEGVGTAVITATFAGDDSYLPGTASYTINVIDPNAPGATVDNPYTVAQARAAIDTGTGVTGVYVMGIISQIDEISLDHGNATYWISDDGSTTNQFEVYRGKSLNGQNFSDANEIRIGDEVVVFGDIKYFESSSVYEFSQGSKIVILNHSAEKAIVNLAFSVESVETDLDGTGFAAPTLSITDETGSPISGLTITYNSSNEDVATVSSTNGNVTIEGIRGTAVITATFAGNDTYYEATASYTINVIDPNVGEITWDLSKNETATATENEISWTSDFASMRNERGTNDNGTPGTSANNYYPGTEGQNYTSTRFYKFSTLTITPAEGYKITSITFTATTDGYATALANSSWTNATASVDGNNSKLVTVTPSNSLTNVQAVIGGTCGFTAVTVAYEKTDEIFVDPTITVSPTNIELTAEENDGTIELTYKDMGDAPELDIIYLAADGETATSYDWIAVGIENGTISYHANENTDTEARTAYFKVYGLDAEANDVYSDLITITQAAATQVSGDVVIVEEDKTTFLFNTEGNEWGFPEGSANKTAEEATFTANGYSITIAGDEGNGYYYNTTGKYLILGKNGAFLTLPAFDFAVGKIVIEGNKDASASVSQNIYVGDEAVSSATTGATGTNTYVIASAYQAAENVYTLKVLSSHNTQITKIVVHKATGEEKVDPQLKYSATTATATLGQDFTAPTLSYVEGFDGTITYTSENEEVATVDADGIVTILAVGTAVIKASFAGNDTYEAAEASYTLTVKEAAVVGNEKFELVTDASTLAADDVILLAYVGDITANEITTSYNHALSTENRTSNRGAIAITVNADGTITPNSETQQITLEGDANGWYFNIGTGYLYASSSSSNQMKVETEPDANDNAMAAISIAEDGTATIRFQGTNSRKEIHFNPNNGTPIFSCYAENSTTGALPQIYKKIVKGDVNNDKVVTIADVTALVNIILGKATPENNPEYNFEAAKVNEDDIITIADVTALVNIILGKQ